MCLAADPAKHAAKAFCRIFHKKNLSLSYHGADKMTKKIFVNFNSQSNMKMTIRQSRCFPCSGFAIKELQAFHAPAKGREEKNQLALLKQGFFSSLTQNPGKQEFLEMAAKSHGKGHFALSEIRGNYIYE